MPLRLLEREDETERRKQTATDIMQDAAFHVHKWHSNSYELDRDDAAGKQNNDESTALSPDNKLQSNLARRRCLVYHGTNRTTH